MKKNTKVSLGLVLSLALLFGLVQPAYASGDWTVGRSYEWSPYITDATATSYPSSLRAYTEFYFDKAGADAHNSYLYFTMEENCGDGRALSGDVQYSNIPDAHFDYDDDDGDGYQEESEVVIGISGVLNTSTYYYFTTWWNKAGSVPAGTMSYIAQRSAYNPFNGEYEALYYDLLTQKSYSSIAAMEAEKLNSISAGVAENISEQKIVNEDFGIEDNGTYLEESVTSSDEIKITIQPKINTLSDVKVYNDMQASKIQNLRNSEAKAAQGRLAQGTVTFNRPISINTLESILKESNADLKDAEIKLINEKGEWITANATTLNQDSIDKVTNEIIENGLAKSLTYEGITSARVKMNIYNNSYETLSSNNNVFFVDMMDEIVRQEHGDFDGKIKVRVFDLSWSIDNLK